MLRAAARAAIQHRYVVHCRVESDASRRRKLEIQCLLTLVAESELDTAAVAVSALAYTLENYAQAS